MKAAAMAMLAVLAASSLPALADDAGNTLPPKGVPQVEGLGRMNGVALACEYMALSGRTRKAMLDYVPKTQQFGDLFEQSTNAAFNEQTKSEEPCPDMRALSARLFVLETSVRSLFAPSAEAAK